MKKFILVVMMMILSVPAMADTGGGVLGALIGAAIGNQIGGGNGKKVATVVGALAGANVGSRLEDGTYGQNANGEYVCVNCGTSYRQGYGNYDREAEAAAARGEAARLQREHDRERAYTLRQAYCSQDPEGCRHGRGYAYNSGHPIIWR